MGYLATSWLQGAEGSNSSAEGVLVLAGRQPLLGSGLTEGLLVFVAL